MEQIFAYLRERLNGQRKVELNQCIALLSQYYINGGAIDSFPILKGEIDKYVKLNPNRLEISILEKWASSFSDGVKRGFISKHFNIGRNNVVDIPEKGRANVVVVDSENNRLVHIEKLYDTIKAYRNGINRITHPYIWQWSISASEYDDICDALSICKSLGREEVNDLIKNEKCVFIIVAFIAEQYKREWFGNNGNKENALEQLGLDDKVDIIAKTYFGDRSKDIIFKHPFSGRLEYLDSLRVEGGLPIKYIVEGDNQLSNFADKLFREYEQAIKFLLEQLDNKCIRHSYKANYSIYQYLEAIKSEEGPYNIYGPDSENIEIFKKFTSILKSGREKAKQETCKFGLEYSVWRWKYSEEFTLHQNLIFRQSDIYKETNDTISIERLKQWNIEPTYVFWLRIGNKDYEFHPWKDRYYHSILGYSKIFLRDVDLSKSILPEVSIAYIPQNSDGSKDIDNIKEISNAIPLPKKDYLMFSSNDGHRWSQNSNGIYSAVLVINLSFAAFCTKKS